MNVLRTNENLLYISGLDLIQERPLTDWGVFVTTLESKYFKSNTHCSSQVSSGFTFHILYTTHWE